MPGDLPAGKYTAVLVGAWWPLPSSTLRAGAQHWGGQQQQQEQYAQDLRSQWTRLASGNQGHTADDLVSRLHKGEKYHLDLAEKYKVKADAFAQGADAIDSLRAGLRGIADDYNQRIANVESSKESGVTKAAEIEKLIAEANGFALHKSGAAVSTITDATRKILTTEGIRLSPEEFLKSRGLSTTTGLAKGNKGDGGPPGTAGFRGAQQPGGGGGGSAPILAPAGGGHVPGAPAVNSPIPGGGGVSPAAAFGGPSPNSLGNSFATGMMTGQPAAAGAQSLSAGAMNAMGAGSAPPPQAAPPLAAAPLVPVSPTAGGESIAAAHSSVDTPSTTPATPVVSTSGGAAPVAPAVMTGGSWSAPAAQVAGGPAVPAGPLPAYGSDLRPPVVAPPATPSVPTAPVSGAPVAPSPASSASAGGPLVSPVERAASVTAAGQAGVSSSTMAGASALSATTGATAGAVSSRAAEQQRLQHLVDAVARQEPRLSWAAGLREEGTTSLLVTDLAAGWIPPHLRLPANLTLLEPTARRRDASVIDLLGAVVAAAAHQPNAYITEPGPDDPALTGDRVARSAAPKVDEFGPTLVEAVRRRDGLPRIAQALAAPAVRKTGVLENEVEALRRSIAEIQHSVLNTYPNHDLAAVGDWMLLAAIEALIDEHEYLANYHMAWFAVMTRHDGSTGFAA